MTRARQALLFCKKEAKNFFPAVAGSWDGLPYDHKRLDMIACTVLCITLFSAGSSQAQLIRRDCYASCAKVDVLQDGTFKWNGTFVASLSALDEKFAELSRTSPCPTAELIPSRMASYQLAASVRTIMEKHGVWSGIVGNIRQ
jgi:hypothetical protein